MLIGATFAWFTDTASTAVNKIQAGTLDVALEMNTGTTDNPTWVSAEGQTLEFKKAAEAIEKEVLWEPGCTYELPELRVVNNGNLALKYKVIITGIQGDAELNKAIEWTIGNADKDKEYSLGAKATSEALTIKGTMKTDADKKYQGLSIDGISVTVVATQDTVEYDSYNNKYDDQASYPVIDSAGLSAAVANDNAIVAMTDGEFTLSSDKDGKNSVSITANNLTIFGDGSGETVLKQDETKYYKFSGDNTTLKNITIDASSRSGGYYYVVDLAGNNTTLDGVTIKNAKTSGRGYDAVSVEVAAGTTCRITNCNISGEGYLITSASGKLNGTLLIEDTKLNVDGHGDSSLDISSGTGKLIANRSEITGRNSIGAEAVFTDCIFKKDGKNVYSYVSNSKDTSFVNCSFDNGFYFSVKGSETQTVTFENCYYNGTRITEDNYKSFTNLISGKNANLTVVVK